MKASIFRVDRRLTITDLLIVVAALAVSASTIRSERRSILWTWGSSSSPSIADLGLGLLEIAIANLLLPMSLAFLAIRYRERRTVARADA